MLISSAGGMWNRSHCTKGSVWGSLCTCSCLQLPGQRSPGWQSLQTFRFSGSLELAYQSIWFIWEVLLVLPSVTQGKLTTTNSPDLMSCSFGLCSNRSCSGSSASFWAKAKHACGNHLFLFNAFFFFQQNLKEYSQPFCEFALALVCEEI